MKKKFLILYIFFACFALHKAGAQYSIKIGGFSSSPTSICGGYPDGSIPYIELLNAGVPVTNYWIYQSCGPYSGFLPLMSGTAPGVPSYIPTYLVSSPCLRTYSCSGGFGGWGTASGPGSWGTVVLYGYTGTFSSPGSSPVCSLTVTIVPGGETIPGAITGSTAINGSGTLGLNTGISFVTSPATWAGSNGYQTFYYNLTPSSGSSPTCIVTPQTIAPLTAGGFITATLPGSPSSYGPSCGNNYANTGQLTRTPHLSSNLTNNIFCSGTGILSCDIGDNPATGGCPSGTPVGTLNAGGVTTLIHQSDVKLTREWHSGSPTGPLLGTGMTQSVGSAGTYYLIVKQFNNTLFPANTPTGVCPTHSYYDYSPTPSYTSTTSITLSNPPAIGSYTPCFTINGNSLVGTSLTAPFNFVSCPSPTLTFNGSCSSGPTIYGYKLIITRISPAGTPNTITGSGTPPSSSDITSYFPTAGIYTVQLSLFNGCTYSTPITGYIHYSNLPTNNVDIQVTKYFAGSSVGHTCLYSYAGNSTCSLNVATNYGLAYTSPALVGRYNTIFYEDISSTLNGSVPGSYYYQLFSVGTGGVLTAVCAATSPTTVSSSGVPLIAINISALCSSPPSPPYFYTAANLGLYALKVTLTNACGPITSTVYFQIDDVVSGNGYYRQASNNANNLDDENTISFNPVPFKEMLTANLNLAAASSTSLSIMTADGRVITNAWQNENTDKGSSVKTINTSNWAPGMYFYEFMINGKSYTGKIVKD